MMLPKLMTANGNKAHVFPFNTLAHTWETVTWNTISIPGAVTWLTMKSVLPVNWDMVLLFAATCDKLMWENMLLAEGHPIFSWRQLREEQGVIGTRCENCRGEEMHHQSVGFGMGYPQRVSLHSSHSRDYEDGQLGIKCGCSECEVDWWRDQGARSSHPYWGSVWGTLLRTHEVIWLEDCRNAPVVVMEGQLTFVVMKVVSIFKHFKCVRYSQIPSGCESLSGCEYVL